MLRKVSRLPVILAVIGAFLNSGDLLAEFQPAGRSWVGYVAAASVGLGLYLCVEALLQKPHWSVIAGVIFFGIAEVSGQVLHAALVRADVVVMTDTMRWLMGYISPSLVVISGVVMAFVVQYGFPRDEAEVEKQPLTRRDLAQLEHLVNHAASNAQTVPLTDVLTAANSIDDPAQYHVDVHSRLLRKNGTAQVVAYAGVADE